MQFNIFFKWVGSRLPAPGKTLRLKKTDNDTYKQCLNNGRGHDRGHVKAVAISVVADVAILIAIVAPWLINNIAQIIIT